MSDRSIWDSLTALWDDFSVWWDEDREDAPPVILPGPGMPYRHQPRPRRRSRLMDLCIRAVGSGVVMHRKRPR